MSSLLKKLSSVKVVVANAFMYPHICTGYCYDYVWREIEPEEILSTRQAVNESIISMLSNTKMLK